MPQLHKDFLTQYFSSDQIENNEMGGVYRVLVGKPEGKGPLGRPRRRWEDNIKMDFQECDVGACTGSNWLRAGTGV